MANDRKHHPKVIGVPVCKADEDSCGQNPAGSETQHKKPSEKRKRTKMISVRVDETEHATIHAYAANAQFRTVQDYLRALGLKNRFNAAAPVLAERDEVRRLKIQLGQVGGVLREHKNLLEKILQAVPAAQLTPELQTEIRKAFAHAQQAYDDTVEANRQIRRTLGYAK